MSTANKYLYKKSLDATPEIECFFRKRSCESTRDDNSLWLITLADLLCILLIFSFFITSTNIKQNTVAPQEEINSHDSKSLVSVAQATIAKRAYLSLPVNIGNTKTAS
ncbi:MAG: hypothetical protein WCQ99_17590, partial [Pseudomonadota bacterium]